MQSLSWKNIWAFESLPGKWLALQKNAMQVAELDAPAQKALRLLSENNSFESESNLQLIEARDDLSMWNDKLPEALGTSTKVNEISSKPPTIQSLTINVSQLCNLRCTYCYADGGTYKSAKGLIDVKKASWQITNAIKRLSSGDEFEIRFFGGEPMLHPEAIYELTQIAKDEAAKNHVTLLFEIVTNGTIVPDGIPQFLAENSFGVMVSLDGPADIQNKTRPTANGQLSSELLEKNVVKLAAVKDRLRFFKSHTVLGGHNLDAAKSFLYSESLGFNLIGLGYASDANNEIDQVNVERYTQEISKLMDFLWNNGGEERLSKIETVAIAFSQLDNAHKLLNHCSAGQKMLSIDTKNDYFLCHRFTGDKAYQIGSFETGIHEGMRAPYLKTQSSKQKCSSCPVQYLCGGGCFHVNYFKSGNALTPDDQFCFRQIGFFKTVLKYYYMARTGQGEMNESEKDHERIKVG